MSYFGEFDQGGLYSPASFFDEDMELDTGSVSAARLYFPASTAAAVSPAFNGFWSSTTGAVRRELAITKGTSAIAAGSTISFGAATDFVLDRQYVSPPMKAQTIVGSTTIKMQLMTREYDLADNVDYVITSVRVFSNDGTTEKANLLNFAGYGTVGNEFINNATHRNCVAINGTWDISTNGDYGGGDYVVDEGDRLVVDIGYGINSGSGTTPQASAKWGENASDLPEDDTQTTDGAPWIEFSQSILFQAGSGGTVQTGAVSYNISLTKSVSGVATRAGSVAYNISVTETAAGNKTATGSVAYNIGLTESADGRAVRGGAVAYNISLTEAASGLRVANGAVAYTISVTETASGVRAASGSVNYLISISKTVSGNVPQPPRANLRGYVVGSGQVRDSVTGSRPGGGVVRGSQMVIADVVGSGQIRGRVNGSSN